MKLLALILSLCACAVSAATNDYSGCFVPGETAEYKVKWMGLPLAWSRTETDAVTLDGRALIRVRLTTRTYKTYKHIYAVDDVTEVILDPVTALPVQLDFVLNEGTIHKSHFTRFDHENLTATHIDRISNTTNSVAIEPETRDILCFLYAARARDLQSMAEAIHHVFVEGRVREMGVSIGEQKRIKVPDVGKVASVKIEPIAEFDGLFLRQGKIFFWVSKQKRRMVVLIEAKVAVGKISVKLRDVSGPGDDFWVRREEKE